jgi:hypothetical protein
MSMHALTTLAFRLMGLCCLLLALARGAVALILAMTGQGWMVWPVALSAGALAVLALLFFLFSGRLADYAAPREEAPAIPAVDGATLLAVGFSLLGSLVLFRGAEGIVWQAGLAWRSVPDLLEAVLGGDPPR